MDRRVRCHATQSDRMNGKMTAAYLGHVLLCTALLVGTNCGHAPQHNESGVVQHSLIFGGSDYQYFLSKPATSDGTNALPVLFLVHGSGGDGLDFIQFWRDLANQNGIILLAPTFRFGADLEKQVPELFRALVEDAKKYSRIDPRRVYLFGYSAGGYCTFDAATLDSTYFTAAAVFAGIITPDYDGIVQQARRKTPIAMYIGDHDQFFSLAETRRTRDLLLVNGFPVHYVEIAHQDHNYGAISATVNEDAWTFMSKFALP